MKIVDYIYQQLKLMQLKQKLISRAKQRKQKINNVLSFVNSIQIAHPQPK